MHPRLIERVVNVPQNVVLTYLVQAIGPAEGNQRLRVHIGLKHENSFTPAAAHQFLKVLGGRGVDRGHAESG